MPAARSTQCTISRGREIITSGRMAIPATKRRVLGVDVGRRRIGLAVSDATGTLARPLVTLTIGDQDAVTAVAAEAARLERDEEGLAAVVVGLPVALDGTPTDATKEVSAFIDALRARTTIPVVSEDERLTSREAESRLALCERDWRKRKVRLDAAAAAIILQDYLDRRRDDR
jgi:putative Holliday junction resolvase